jgi:hypothetical protein
VQRNHYEADFIASAEFTRFLAVYREEYREFYDAIGLNKKK